jgi:ATP-dependent Zn protease
MASRMADYMVKKLGMSEKLGLRVIPDPGGYSGAADISPNTHEVIDSEIKCLLNSSYSRACAVLRAHRSELDQERRNETIFLKMLTKI